MKLESVTFPEAFRCGGDQRKTWIRSQHACEIWIDGEYVWVQKGASKAFASRAQILHATVVEERAKAAK